MTLPRVAGAATTSSPLPVVPRDADDLVGHSSEPWAGALPDASATRSVLDDHEEARRARP